MEFGVKDSSGDIFLNSRHPVFWILYGFKPNQILYLMHKKGTENIDYTFIKLRRIFQINPKQNN